MDEPWDWDADLGELTPEQMASAQRNIEATKKARATDPTIYHVTALDPATMRYLTPEEVKEMERNAILEIARLERKMAAAEAAKRAAEEDQRKE